MNVLVALLALVPGGGLTRISYDVVLETGARGVSMRMVVNMLGPDRVALRCRKMPSGTLFSYWATPGRNVLMFPRDNLAFEGHAEDPFRLFPDGPELTRAQWLDLLDGKPPEEMTGFTFTERADGWREISARDHEVIIRWQERSRRETDRYREEIFVPTFPAHYEIGSLRDMILSWNSDAID